MTAGRVLVNGSYLELLRMALHPMETRDAGDFAEFLNFLKFRLREEGRDELLYALVTEELSMIAGYDEGK